MLRMSAAGDCERNLWAGLNDIPEDKEIEPRILALFDHGNAIEVHVIRLLRLSGRNVIDVDPGTNDQFELVDFDGKEVGHIDGKIETGSRPTNRHLSLLEIKSANTKQFNMLLELGYVAWKPTYASQIQKYMGNADLPDALVIVYCKDDSRIHAERILYDPVAFFNLRGKAHRIIESTELLNRPPEAKSQYCKFCKYCNRNQWCWAPTTGANFDD